MKVEEAVENKPAWKPIAVPVALYDGKAVNGKAKVDVRNPASLVNHESLTDDEAMVETIPFDPVKAKPCDSDGKKSDELKVEDAVEKRPFEKPIVVPVALYPTPVVNGDALLTVTAPVLPETVTFVPARSDVTPEFVTLPFAYDSPPENVVVAAP